jgi:arginase family enzyme
MYGCFEIEAKYMSENWKCITLPTPSFTGFPVCTQLDDLQADIAIIGLHYVSAYPRRLPATTAKTVTETAPDAIRRQSSRFIDHLDHFDFDFNDVLLAGRQVRMVDCGDVDKQLTGGEQNPENITAAVRTILNRSAIPFVLGADEGGLTFHETTDLVRGIAQKGSIVGMNLFEVRPELDTNDLTASTAAHLIINFIGTLAHSGQIGR